MGTIEVQWLALLQVLRRRSEGVCWSVPWQVCKRGQADRNPLARVRSRVAGLEEDSWPNRVCGRRNYVIAIYRPSMSDMTTASFSKEDMTGLLLVFGMASLCHFDTERGLVSAGNEGR